MGLPPHTPPEVAGLGRLPTLGLRLCSRNTHSQLLVRSWGYRPTPRQKSQGLADFRLSACASALMPLRAVLGLRPRRCSRVQCPKPLAGSGVRALNPLALALTDAPCPAARSPAAPTWLGLSACALLSGLLLRAARRMPAVAVPNFPMARQFRWPRAGVSGTSPALTHRRLALTDAPCFFVTLAAACSRPTGSAPTLRRPLGAPVPSEFRACGAPVPTLRRSPPLRGRAVMTFFFGWRPER